jgi:glycosyltransferase involved in cell wall biosynthesis
MDKHIQKQGTVTDNEIVSVFPVEARKRLLPTLISRLVMGANVISPWHGRQDVVVIEDVYGLTKLSVQDFAIAKEVAERITKELGLQMIVPSHQVLVIRDRAQEIVASMTDCRAGKKGIIMLKDQGGCGYWRMSLPAKYINRDGIYIDVTGGTLGLDGLLEYDTIFVQRVCNWDYLLVLERLKKAGKRIVYDVDDDIFAIPSDNPASKGMGRSEQMAAVECMKIADVVTTTTSILQERFTSLLGRAPVVVPNAIDPDDGWNPTPMTGSPDGKKRIFWQGSNTHDEDWNECFDAVDRVMKKRSDVRVVIMGFLPTLVKESLGEPHWKDRVEYIGSMAPEAYFRLIKHVRGDVGLAPLRHEHFNLGKSSIKWIENSVIGMPTVASDVAPYSDVIEHGVDGFICSDTDEWEDAIDVCLDNDSVRRQVVENARVKVRREFNIKTVSETWRRVLVGDDRNG